MKVLVKRMASDNESTLSLVYVDDEFVCFGIEDEPRVVKVAGETRIPSGTYDLGLRKEGGFHSRYSVKFPDIHRGMLEVKDVPNFTFVLIHVGNTEKDTSACLVVGLVADARKRPYKNQSSVDAYTLLYKKVIDEAEKGNCTITYENHDLKGVL